MAIYTRNGDNGETRLFKGKKAGKDSLYMCALGDLDELNSVLGLCKAFVEDRDVVSNSLTAAQKDIMKIMSVVAGEEALDDGIESGVCDFGEKIKKMELWIDELESRLPKLTQFILPGGGVLGAHLHFARTVCRRAERSVVGLMKSEKLALNGCLPYLNRLSDLLFVMARFVNFEEGAEEVKN